MTTNPTIALAHGFWGGAAHWSKVILHLSKKGYQSVNAVENPLTSLSDDAERTSKMLRQQQGPILLVGHFYGRAVMTEISGLPNVVGLVYIAVFAPDSGEIPGGITQNNTPVPLLIWRPTVMDISGSKRRNFTKASARISPSMRR